MPTHELFATRASRMKASEIRELLKLLEQPGLISFAGGIPDPALFPAEEFSQAFQTALGPAQRDQALQYSTTEGYAHCVIGSWITCARSVWNARRIMF